MYLLMRVHYYSELIVEVTFMRVIMSIDNAEFMQSMQLICFYGQQICKKIKKMLKKWVKNDVAL